ncbi:FadR/GntR family transcriptional regulator [Falsihalocynthiibacter sp. SS001]|uniref:FadR/GntR family transcriptional regulator n=1 Tax=Falsihalocynthiibacter sp. SS001 TaxID=3349698 RepID=UPI0036D21F6D
MKNAMMDLDKRPLHTRVAESIEAYIEQNNMRPGDELPSEAELCELTGVSRVVVRSALSQLAGRGVVKISSGRRARVGSLDPEVLATLVQHGVATSQITVAKVLEVRRGVEVAASRLAAMRRTEEQADALTEICTLMEQSIDKIEEFVEHDFAFHLKIAEATDNQLYTYIIQPLSMSIKASIAKGREKQSDKDKLARIQDTHRAIERAIREKDPEAAATAMSNHFEYAAEAVVN